MIGRLTDGAPEPLGVAPDTSGANVAVFSAHAAAIELCLFDDADEEFARIRLPARSGDVFHGHIEGLKEGQRYGFRAYGPDAPEAGQRFNPAKLLVDPYALALDRPFALHPSLFAYGEAARVDSAAHLPKAIVTKPVPAEATRPKHPWRDTVIYELHVKGFTATHPDIPQEMRGTFAGLAHDAAIAHLKRLGVTTLELLPSAAWIDERHLPPLGLSDYWGYNPIAMMAPDPRLAPGGWRDVREAVARLHDAGFEIILDVVFNHTGESDEFGPTVSFRGLDNASYYRLADDPARYVNDSACGNVLACDRRPVVRLIMDALRAWALYGGVDGFRFDLATTLARAHSGFDRDAPFLSTILQDPVLRDLKLIAEPWDMGPGGYRLGEFPEPFAEWNDRYRDGARGFWRGDSCGVAELATRFAGSQDMFARRRPSRSVNFITAHDGFTLRDLVSYAHKHNEANGEDNRDGSNHNLSWNNGVEGESEDAAIHAARARDARNLLATLLFSRGTPMLAMGSELGKTQSGNNNVYAQDNALSWIEWPQADDELIETTAKLIALRKRRPALREDRFLDSEPHDATLIPDVEWLRPDGAPMREDDWRDDEARTLVVALYAEDDRVLVILHGGADEIIMRPPPARDNHDWRWAFNSAKANASEDVEESVSVAPRSVALLVEERGALRRSIAPASEEILSRLAEATGVERRWRDVDGALHDAPRETICALLAQLGFPANTLDDARESLARLSEFRDRRALPASLSAQEGAPWTLRLAACDGRTPGWIVVTQEDGSQSRVALRAENAAPVTWRGTDGRGCDGVEARLPPLPIGRHHLALESGEACALTVAPARCYLPDDARRDVGLSAQLYSVRREGDQGIGDFSTLAELARVGAKAGAALIAINPLHALFAQDRTRASPYYPSDRRFLDPLYIDLAELGRMLGASIDFEHNTAAALGAAAHVDYPGVHALKMAALERAFAVFLDLSRRQPDAAPAASFQRFIARDGAALARFCLFEAISEARNGQSRRTWPQELRDARDSALSAFSNEHATRIQFHQFLQWLADAQFAHAAQEARAAGLSLGFCRDLAIGAAPDGAESWSRAGSFVDGFSIGAPPDAFSREGQNWGLPPPDPIAMEKSGGAGFAELLRANMRHAGALRIDHVMGLARLFVVPDGERPAAGAYLNYPFETLLGQLALESRRAQCIVVGEDLGTAPWGFRERIERADVLSYRVLWFERSGEGFAPPAFYPRKAMACASTHDLPTLEGWWAAADIAEREALGLLTAQAADAARAARRAEKNALLEALRAQALIDDARQPSNRFDDSLAQALHAFIARAPSLLAMAQLDDLAGETLAINLPGTDRERLNWRRRLPESIDALVDSRRARAILAGLCRNLDAIPGAYRPPGEIDAADGHERFEHGG
ncbi:glycogen debranching protein GlgX [Methylocystis sp. SC2]|uniref:glycogen debranching protein GlgX n=1 Tax=Methylocystis sp. (strain SC2) TaxID=187303 RepID=UPI00027AEA15|nr:glycogen debranching protein GlgX [Methylocystis sp. SC2]CCJ07417.1 Glycogen debranching enzyme GlgX [Methylocystis sp. SC2]